MSTIQSLGIGSGLKIDEIVTALVDAEKVPKEQAITKKEEIINAKVSAYGEMKSKLATLQSSVSSLRLAGSYNKKEAVSSDESAFTASASSLAEVGNYSVSVNKLAKSQSLASGSFASINDVIGTGTLTVRFGTTTFAGEPPAYGFAQNTNATEKTITITNENNTLAGFKDHINANDYGFKASIINDGNGFRLVMTAESGVNNSMQISVTGDGDGNNGDNMGLSQLAMDNTQQNLTQNVAAQNAELSINGIPITSASNTVSNAVNGLTLNLLEETTAARNISVTSNTADLKEQVKGMVDSYNEFISYTADLTSYSGATGKASLLLGDSTVRTMVNQLRTTMFSQVSGVGSGLQALSNIGILSTKSNGTLEFDEAKFDEVLASSGSQFQALFAASGTSTDANIQFVSNSTLTTPGDYNVKISQLATKGSFTGQSTLPDFAGGSTLTIDNDNDGFTVRIDGIESGPLTLAKGVFNTGEALANNLQTTINNSAALKAAGRSVAVTYNQTDNRFEFASTQYGSATSVAFNAVDTNSGQLGLFLGSGTSGTDVAGSINGEEATGAGQFLSVNTGPAAGLKINVTGGAFGPGGVDRGSVTFSRGVADQLDKLIEGFLKTDDGYLTSRMEGLDRSLESLTKEKQAFDFYIERFEVRLLAQFNAIDSVVGQLNNLGSFLESALSSLPGAQKKD